MDPSINVTECYVATEAHSGDINSPESNSSYHKEEMHTVKHRVTVCRVFEILVLLLIMVVIFGLYQIPTALYIRFNVLPSDSQVTVKSSTDCSNASISKGNPNYPGGFCQGDNVSREMCFPDPLFPSVLDIPTSATNQQKDDTGGFNLFIRILPLLDPSQECVDRIVPSLCLQVFGFCDETKNNLSMTLRDACLEIRDHVCTREWSTAANLLSNGVLLPICEDLPDTTDECIVDNMTSDEQPLVSTLKPLCGDQNSSEPCDNQTSGNLDCADGFYLDVNGTNICRPLCIFRHMTFAVLLTLVKMIALMIFCVMMFIIAFTTQRETLLVFPSILLVYLCVTIFIFAFTFIVGFFDKEELFCGSMDLLYTLGRGNETVFCSFTGFVFLYGLEQMGIWTAMHAFFLYWAVAHPFSYRRFKASGKIRYVHAACILLALLVPLPAGLAPLKDGYKTTPSLSLISCDPREPYIFYFSFILPTGIIISFCNCFIVLIFWTIIKEFVVKKLLAKKKVENVTRAQVKLLIILTYYIVNGVFGLANITYGQLIPIRTLEIFEYFICQSTMNQDCRLNSELDGTSTLLAIINFFIFAGLPLVVFIFSVDFRVCKIRQKQKSTKEASA